MLVYCSTSILYGSTALFLFLLPQYKSLSFTTGTNQQMQSNWSQFVADSQLACVVSVSVGLGSKESQRNRIFLCFALAKNGPRAKKRKEGEEGGGKERKRLQKNPWILKTAFLTFHAWVRQRKPLQHKDTWIMAHNKNFWRWYQLMPMVKYID